MKKKILVVDDDLELIENYVDILSNSGYQVTPCADPNKAIYLHASNNYDLVILDISINGDKRAGHILCRIMKKTEKNTYIVMNTAIDGNYDRHESVLNGADGFWRKDSNLIYFLNKVNDFMSNDSD